MHALAHKALNILLPPRCLGCESLVEQPGDLCAVCWGKIHFITPPFCAICGAPLPYESEEEITCGSCISNPPRYERAVSVFVYDDASSKLITRYKYHDQTHATFSYARWMVRAAGELAAKADCIAPVPLHPWRLFTRRYNQAALLAHAISRICQTPYEPQLLKRIKRTSPQTGLARKDRLKNVKRAFTVASNKNIKGKSVLLVDDVMTTGATIQECSHVLKRAGAKQVFVATLARRGLES